MKFKIRHADSIVGTLSIIAMAVLVILIFSIGSKQKWFAKKYPYYTVFTSGNNLSEGMALQYKGFPIGKVTSIKINEKDEVIVKYTISEEYHDRIKSNSIIELAVSPIGLGSQMLFHPGNASDILEIESLIPEKNSEEGKRRIAAGYVKLAPGSDTITTLVGSVGDLLNNLNGILGQLDGILSGQANVPLTRVFESVDKVLGQAGTAIDNVSGLLEGDESIPASSVIASLGRTIDDLNNILNGASQAPLANTFKNIETFTGNIKDPSGLVPRLIETEQNKGAIAGILGGVDSTIGNVQNMTTGLGQDLKQVDAVLVQVQVLLKQVQDVMEGLKNNPLIKGGVPNRMNNELAAPSLRDENF